MRILAVLGCTALMACGPKADQPTVAPGDADADPSSEAASNAEPESEPSEEAPAEVTAKLHNLCDKPQTWVIIEGDVTPDPSAGQEIQPGATEDVKLGPDQWVAKKDDAGAWSSRARTDTEGGHVWLSSSCKGVASSNDPGADPAALDAKMREAAGASTGQ
jgi:hypothetical protein